MDADRITALLENMRALWFNLYNPVKSVGTGNKHTQIKLYSKSGNEIVPPLLHSSGRTGDRGADFRKEADS